MKSEEYVSQQEGAYRVGGTRVSLDSIVYAFLEGQTPETIVQWYRKALGDLLASHGQEDHPLEVSVRLVADRHGWRCRARASFW
jgi:hypothetical protein